MKSVIKNKPEIKYPCLMVGGLSGVIVLMASYGKGTVVHGKSSKGLKVGMYGDDWSMTYFKPLDGTVELSN